MQDSLSFEEFCEQFKIVLSEKDKSATILILSKEGKLLKKSDTRKRDAEIDQLCSYLAPLLRPAQDFFEHLRKDVAEDEKDAEWSLVRLSTPYHEVILHPYNDFVVVVFDEL